MTMTGTPSWLSKKYKKRAVIFVEVLLYS